MNGLLFMFLLLDNKIFTDAYDVNSITDQYFIDISIYQHDMLMYLSMF